MSSYRDFVNQDNLDGFYHAHKKYKWIDAVFKDEQYWISKYLKYLRKEEWFLNERPNKFMRFYYLRKKNILGAKLGILIHVNCFGPGLKIYHCGSIVANPATRVGSGCIIHGSCTFGNKGDSQPDCAPHVGNNVEIGVNSLIIGDITIADNVIIGGGSVVLHSITDNGAVVAGNPAKRIR